MTQKREMTIEKAKDVYEGLPIYQSPKRVFTDDFLNTNLLKLPSKDENCTTTDIAFGDE